MAEILMSVKFAGVAALCGLAVAAAPGNATAWVYSPKTGGGPIKYVIKGSLPPR